jgi:hypothetical protein
MLEGKKVLICANMWVLRSGSAQPSCNDFTTSSKSRFLPDLGGIVYAK